MSSMHLQGSELLACRMTHREGKAVCDLQSLAHIQPQQLSCDKSRSTLLAVLQDPQSSVPINLHTPQSLFLRLGCSTCDSRKAWRSGRHHPVE